MENSIGLLESWEHWCLWTHCLVKCETNRSYWKWGSYYDCIFTIIYVSPTKMVTVNKHISCFLHAKRDPATWHRCHNYTSLKLFYKRQGELVWYFFRWTNEKILQLQWKHLKYCIIICHNFHAIFHVLKVAPMLCSLLQGMIIWE